MSTSINTDKYLGTGKRFIIPPANVSCPPFVSSLAQTYWNALTAANGGVEVNGSLYGITTCALKAAIDNWFIAANPTISGRVYLHIGGTQATHAIEAFHPGTYSLNFSAGVTYTAQGSIFNGSSYADTGIVPGTDFGSNSFHVSAKTTSAGNGSLMGCRDSAGAGTDKVDLIYTSPNLRIDMYTTSPAPCIGTSRVNVAASANAFSFAQRDTNNLYLYQNGTQIGTVSGAYCGTLPTTARMFIGALNSANTSQLQYFTGTMAFNSIGKAMSPSFMTTFTTATNTLMSILGR